MRAAMFGNEAALGNLPFLVIHLSGGDRPAARRFARGQNLDIRRVGGNGGDHCTQGSSSTV